MFSPIKRTTVTFLAAAALAVIVLFGGVGSTVYAAKPGDPLYRVKVSMEQALQVASKQAETPVPTNEVELTGTIEAINGDILTINGQQVQVTNLTETKGTIAVGETVKVHAAADASGMLVAREIETATPGLDDNGNGDDSSEIDDDHGNDGVEISDDDSSEIDDDHSNDGVEISNGTGTEIDDDHSNDGIEAGDDHGSSVSSDDHEQSGNESDDGTAIDHQDDSSYDDNGHTSDGNSSHDDNNGGSSGESNSDDDSGSHSGKGGSDH
jgi:hypothetical protein